jgi:SpoIIAA-like
VIPAVDAALKHGRKVRFLYLLGEDVTGYSPGAAWQDTKVGLGHYTQWEKVAVVSDKEWLRHSVDIFGYLIPGEIRAFTPAEEGEARTWVST